jgi:hypothetical protein
MEIVLLPITETQRSILHQETVLQRSFYLSLWKSDKKEIL